MQNLLAPELSEPVDRCELVGGTDCIYYCARPERSGGGVDDEVVGIGFDCCCGAADKGDVVLGEFEAGSSAEVFEWCAVEAEDGMHVGGEAVAGCGVFNHQHAATGTTKHHRGAEAAGASSDNDGVVKRFDHGLIVNADQHRMVAASQICKRAV